MKPTGYLSAEYADALSEFGSPHHFQRSLGNILERPINGSGLVDGVGCYPIFSCSYWSELAHDLNDLGTYLVSIVLVTDPFGEYDEGFLRSCFPELVRPYKAHFVIDLSRDVNSFVSSHHQRNSEKALRLLRVEYCQSPLEHLDSWVALYDNLIARHQIRGIARFSPTSFRKQFTVPGLHVFQAVNNEDVVGMILWYVQNEIAYYHLAAYSQLGYELRASFALFWESISFFKSQKARWISLGAGAGVEADLADGLTRFKKGWATGTKLAYLCGRIFDPEIYIRLSQEKGASAASFFPHYRYEG